MTLRPEPPPKFLLELIKKDRPNLKSAKNWYWLEYKPDLQRGYGLQLVCEQCTPKVDLFKVDQDVRQTIFWQVNLTPQYLNLFDRLGSVFVGQCENCKTAYWATTPTWCSVIYDLSDVLKKLDANPEKTHG